MKNGETAVVNSVDTRTFVKIILIFLIETSTSEK